jgi:hypothetical protein
MCAGSTYNSSSTHVSVVWCACLKIRHDEHYSWHLQLSEAGHTDISLKFRRCTITSLLVLVSGVIVA